MKRVAFSKDFCQNFFQKNLLIFFSLDFEGKWSDLTNFSDEVANNTTKSIKIDTFGYHIY